MKNIVTLRQTHIGRYLHELNIDYKKITVKHIQTHGYENFTEGQLNILGQLNLKSPTAMVSLVSKVGLSKQAVSRMVNLCVKHHYIKLIPCKLDSRAKSIVFTQHGLALMNVAAESIKLAEDIFREKLGTDSFASLKQQLQQAYAAMQHSNVDTPNV